MTDLPPGDGSDAPVRSSRWWLNTALARFVVGRTVPAQVDEPNAPTIDDAAIDLDDAEERDFGDYELLQVIGRGGMGVVYRAHQRSLDREVALKLLPEASWTSPQLARALHHEAQHAARLQHPNIVMVFEVGQHAGRAYYVMPLVDGMSLAERLRAGPLPVREAAASMRTVAEAVDYAHRLGVLHLDLKPGNVMIDAGGAPRITDFGLARRLDRAVDGDDRIAGTPGYMAPEQLQVEGALTASTDVWGLGATLYEALTGHAPFEGDDPQAVAELTLHGRPPSPRRYVPSLPRDIEAICLRCLQREPKARYPDARALADDLGRFLEGRAVSVRPLNPLQRTLRWMRREPRLALVAGTTVLALVAGVIATSVQGRRAQDSARIAQHNAWDARHETAWRLVEEQRGYRALPLLATNLAEQETAGEADAAGFERLRLRIAQMGMPAMLEAITTGQPIDVVSFSPDGRWLAVGMQPHTVALYDVATLRERWRVKLRIRATAIDDPKLRRIVFAPDGRHLVVWRHWSMGFLRPSASQGNYRLSLADGRQTQVPDSTNVRLENWAEDGRHVVLAHRDGWIRLYDTEHGWKPLGPRVPHDLDNARLNLLFAPNLAFIATRGRDGSVEILDPRTFRPRHVLHPQAPDRGYDRGFIAWAASPDGRWLALGTRGSAMQLVDAHSGESRTMIDTQGLSTTWMRFSADGRHLGASNENGEFFLFRVPDPIYYVNRSRSVWGFDFDCDTQENCIALLMELDRVTLWRFAGGDRSMTGTPLAPEIAHQAYVPRFASALDAPRHRFATGAEDGTLRLWRIPQAPLRPWLAATLREAPLQFDGRHLVGVDGSSVRVFDAIDARPRSPPMSLPQPPGFAALTADGRTLVASSGPELHVFDWREGRLRHALAIGGSPSGLLLSPDGRIAMAVWQSPDPEAKDLQRLQAFDLHDGRALGPAAQLRFDGGQILSDNRRVLLRTGDHLEVRALGDARRPLLRFPGADKRGVLLAGEDPVHREIVQFVAGGESLTQAHALRRWSLVDGRPVSTLPLSAVADDIAVRAQDGRVAINGSTSAITNAGIAMLIDRDGTRRPVAMTDMELLTRAQAFSADGRVLAQALRQGVLLIDAASGRALGPPLLHPVPSPNFVAQIAFAPDSHTLVARTALGSWLVWPLAPERRAASLVREEADIVAPTAGDMHRPPSAALRASWRERDRAATYLQAPLPGPWSCLVAQARPPARKAGTSPLLLDLSARYTAALHTLQLTAAVFHPSGFGNYCGLPLGVQRLRGVDFDLRGVVELRSQRDGPGRAPDGSTGRIAVPPGRYAALHLLAAISGGGNHDGRPAARLRWHYRDGGTADVPLAVPALDEAEEQATARPGVSIAWRVVYPEAEIVSDATSALPMVRVANPHAQREVAAVEVQTLAMLPDLPEIAGGSGLAIAAITMQPVDPATTSATLPSNPGDAVRRPRRRMRRTRRLLLGTALALVPAQIPLRAQALDEEAITLQRVQVTGSHIRRAAFETAQPLLVLDRNALSRTGLDNVGEILQRLPLHVSDLNSDYNNGGNGEVRVDLRNLGAQRTLVLLNGHRYVNALDGAVDVGSIPLPIVERIEVLTDGASAIYGSDAIAGVVNIITRESYDGLETHLYYAVNEHGDGARRAADVTWGRNAARGNVVLNLSFADQQPIWAGDRTISAVPVHGLPPNDTFAGASAHTPQGRMGFGEGGSAPCGEDGGWLTWDAGMRRHRCFDERSDGYNFAPDNYLRTPYERLALYAQARYELTPRTAFRAELLLHRRESSQQLAPTPIRQFDTGEDPNQHAIATDNLYNPFGEPVTFYSFRPLVRPRRFEQDVTTHYVSFGLDGTFDVGARNVAWDVNLIDARTRNDQSITGGYDLHRVGLGVGPSHRDAGGTARCGTVQAPVADCVPLDVLHGRDGFDSAMYDAIAVDGHYDEERRLRDVVLGLSGEAFDLPAGPLTFAAGAEYRDERGSVSLGPLLTDDAFDFAGSAPEPVDGRTRVREVYVEVGIPLLAGRAWAQALDLDLAVRHSDYSDFGGTTNGKIGIAWRPHDDWLVRGTWSQGYRAPSASELFGTSDIFQLTAPTLVGFDPCVGDPEGIVAERCAADGVPVGDFHPQIGPTILTGSNPDLQPEQARNRSLGVVWSPAALAGLDVSLDWWRIELRDTIDDIPDFELPRMCYEEGIDGACRQLRRDPATGVLTSVDARLFNYGTFELEGYDLSLDLRWQGRWGEFQMHWFTVYLSRYLKEIPQGAPPVSAVGNYFMRDPGWRLRSLLALDWNRGEAGATVRLRYYPSLDEECFWPTISGHTELCDRPDFQSPTFAGLPEHTVDARTYVDLQWRWQPRDGTQLAIGVDNAFDLDPPLSYNSPNSYDPAYDIPGRFWYASWRQRF